MKNEKPSLFVGWIHKGHKRFEVIPESQYKSLLEKLIIEKHVNPGAIFISKMNFVHWVCADYHKGIRDVSIYKFWDEINNLDSPDAYYKPLPLKEEVKEEKPKYGYISPDGRYFQCNYYGHAALEREIVGTFTEIDNPQQYLYDNGWLCIYHDPYGKGQYAVAMGTHCSMTDAQLKVLLRLGIPSNSRGFQKYMFKEKDRD